MKSYNFTSYIAVEKYYQYTFFLDSFFQRLQRERGGFF